MTGILGPKLQILLNEIRALNPETYIEIGCYRCDTMRAVANLGVRRIIGFDLFEDAEPHYAQLDESGAGDEDLPLEGPPVSYAEAQTMGFEVYQGDTAETLKALPGMLIDGPVLVFLDGGHSYETVNSDWEKIQEALPGATVIFDDTSYPGVAEVLRGIPNHRKTFLGYFLMKVEPDVEAGNKRG